MWVCLQDTGADVAIAHCLTARDRKPSREEQLGEGVYVASSSAGVKVTREMLALLSLGGGPVSMVQFGVD